MAPSPSWGWPCVTAPIPSPSLPARPSVPSACSGPQAWRPPPRLVLPHLRAPPPCSLPAWLWLPVGAQAWGRGPVLRSSQFVAVWSPVWEGLAHSRCFTSTDDSDRVHRHCLQPLSRKRWPPDPLRPQPVALAPGCALLVPRVLTAEFRLMISAPCGRGCPACHELRCTMSVPPFSAPTDPDKHVTAVSGALFCQRGHLYCGRHSVSPWKRTGINVHV